MKFKIIFLIFNILILFSFLMIFLLPVLMLGPEYAGQLWSDSWYVAVIFVLILIGINIIFFMNRKILNCLENENWNELKEILDDIIFNKQRLSKMYIRLYISTCVAASSLNEITKLEKLLREKSPAKLKKWALPLGLPYLLADKPAEMKEYFAEFLDSNAGDAGWIKWNYCFALLLLKESEEAVRILKETGADLKDPLLCLSSIYMLSPFSSDEEAGELIESSGSRLRQKMKRDDFKKELEKQRDNVQMMFLARIFEEAVDWLYNSGE